MTTTTPNMSLIEPDVLSTPSPTWASLLNNALTTIDSHDHSTGKGVKITPSGMTISADLPFGSNNATTLRSVRFNNQTSFTSTSNDLACIYVLNNEIYYRDGVGNIVQITSGGSLNTAGFSLSSLSIRDSAFTLQYFGDLTKQARFDLSLISTGTTRTYSLPNVSEQLVSLSATQTMSNKSFDTTSVNVRSAQPIQFYNAGNTFYTAVKAGNNASNLNLTLPISAPTAGQVFVSTDTSGTLGWANTSTTVGAVAALDANTTFTNADNRSQSVTPTAARTYTLPTTSISAGDTWEFFNLSTTAANIITVNASGGSTIDYVLPTGYLRLRALVNTPTTAANWQVLDAYSNYLAYTPTLSAGFGTTSGSSFLYRRQGIKMEIKGRFVTGTTAGSLGTITLPGSFTINTTKVVSAADTTATAGCEIVGTLYQNTANNCCNLVIAPGTSTTLIYGTTNVGGTGSCQPSNASLSTGSTTITLVNAVIPISGWN